MPANDTDNWTPARAATAMRELDEHTRCRLIKEAGDKVFDLRPVLADMRAGRFPHVSGPSGSEGPRTGE